jgi:two-component system cell cycle sensor histidine kinase/response regulator CckA
MEHHNSCVNTKAALDYVADQDSSLIAPLLEAMQPYFPEESDLQGFLSDPNNWVSSSVMIAMYEQVKALLGRDNVVFDIGYQSVARKRLGYIQRVLLFAFRDHRRTLKRLQQINDRFNRNKTVEVVRVHERGAVVRLNWFNDLPLTRDFCLMNQGVYTAVPVIWNDRPLQLEEHKCFFHGDDYCEYHLRWDQFPTLKRILLQFVAPWRLINAALAELEQDKALLKEKYGEVRRLNLNLKSQLDKLLSFQQAGTALLSTLNFQELIHLILTRLVEVSVLDRAALYLLDRKKGTFNIAHGVGVSAGELEAIKDYTVPIGKLTNIVARVAHTGEPEFVEEISKSPINPNNPLIKRFQPDAFIALPLKVHGQVVGVLIGDRKNSDGQAIASEKDFLINFSNQIAIAIHNADLYRKLKQSERQYRQLVENAHDGIWVVDGSGVITFANQRLAQIIGRSKVLGRKITHLVPPSQKPLLIKLLAQNIHGSVAQKEMQMIGKHGKPVTVIVSSVPIMENGRYTGSFAMITDVSEQKKIESHLLHRQKMESIGTMAGGIAHDFNNILTGILGHSSLLRYQLEGQEELRRHVEIIEASSMRAADLIRQILAFSRGTEPVAQKPVDLNRLVHETIGLLESSLGKEFELRLKLSPQATRVVANATQVQQALINLCLNARDAMPDGGRISVHTDPLDLWQPAGTAYQSLDVVPGDYIRLRVSDEGTGIAEAHRTKIFDPFFTTKEVGKGSGLGLAMVYGIVKNARGYVHVESKEGSGSTFDLLFRPAQISEKEYETIPRKIDFSGTETLLLVDDETLVLDLGHEILSNHGYKVLLASEGLEAVQIVSAQPRKIDLVILDLVMPNMDGLATYREIIALAPQMKFVICSGFGSNDPSLAHVPRVSKPFRPEKLVQTIREVLDEI